MLHDLTGQKDYYAHENIMHLLKSGDKQVFDLIMTEFFPALIIAVEYATKDIKVAEDIAEQTLIQFKTTLSPTYIKDDYILDLYSNAGRRIIETYNLSTNIVEKGRLTALFQLGYNKAEIIRRSRHEWKTLPVFIDQNRSEAETK